MTGPTPTGPNSLQGTGFPLTFGAADYVAVMRSQLEMTMQLTAAWAAALSTMSNSLFTPPGTDGPGGRPSHGMWSDEFRGLRSVRDVRTGGRPAAEQQATEFTWTLPVFDQPATGRMLRWLTEPPTVQTNLFDETIELLLDEDIKTAS